MKIKKARKNDLKEIGKLMKKEFSKPPFNEKDSIKNVLKSLNFYLINAEIYITQIEKEVAGVLVFQIERWWEGPVIIIQDLAIKESFKKQGVGRDLMKFIEGYAKNKRVKKIHFETNKKSSAIKFYQRLGYKINKDRISMSKNIK